MNDLAAWQLRGPVRTLRTDIAEWDPDRREWRNSRRTNDVTFDDVGQLTLSQFHNPDGSIFRQARVHDGGRIVEEQYWTDEGPRTSRIHSYDAAGRCTEVVEIQPDGRRRAVERYQYEGLQGTTKTVFLDVPATSSGDFCVGFGIEGSEHSSSAPGAALQAVGYGDGDDLADTVTFRNAAGEILMTIEFSRDEHGRVTREDIYYGSAPAGFPFSPPPEMPEEQRESFSAMIDAVMPNRTFASVLYEYDARGRKIACTTRFTILSEERRTYIYDDHDNPILERSANNVMKARFEGTGHLETEPEATRSHDVRSEYQYDEHGNWIERIVSGRTDASQPFQRTNVEWRRIEYDA